MSTTRSLLLAVALVATASQLVAAPARSPRTRQSARAVSADVYGGYSYTHAGEAGLNGWALSGSYPIGTRLSVVGDLTGHYGSFAGADLSQIAFMAGARYSWPSRARSHGLSPFAEALVGAVKTNTTAGGLSDSDTDWGIALGGGADYALSERWSVRALFHLRLVNGEGTTDADPRLSAGVVYHFR